MKKKLSYRDKLIELAYIYDVKEIKDYEKPTSTARDDLRGYIRQRQHGVH